MTVYCCTKVALFSSVRHSHINVLPKTKHMLLVLLHVYLIVLSILNKIVNIKNIQWMRSLSIIYFTCSIDMPCVILVYSESKCLFLLTF